MKYHNHKVTIGGETFDSRKEANRFTELCLLQRAGKISNLQRQVRYILVPAQYDENGRLLERNVSYVADFVYKENGQLVVEDTKGMKTDVYIVKRKLMLERYKVRIRET